MTTTTLTLSKATQKARQIIQSALIEAMRTAALEAVERVDWQAVAVEALDASDDPIDPVAIAEAAVEAMNGVGLTFEMDIGADVEPDSSDIELPK